MAHIHRPGEIFVFGSNLRGVMGAGAALTAKRYHGAIEGRGEGIMGKSYALPTKRTPWEPLTLPEVAEHVATFISYAQTHRSYDFFVTAVGCGLAGFKPEQIAPMFANAPSNCRLPPGWREIAMGVKWQSEAKEAMK